MATNTENLGLKKPGQEDFYNVDDFNENFDKIDEFASRKDNPHGVTAVQTGALPLAGGTITSSVLGLGGGHGSITGCETFTGITGLKDKDTNNNRTLRVINPKYDTYPLKKAVQLVDKIDGTSKEYNLYGEHNKPTADDVGALPNTGGTLNGDLIVSNNNNPSVCCEKTNADGSSAETIVRQYGGYTSFISRNNPKHIIVRPQTPYAGGGYYGGGFYGGYNPSQQPPQNQTPVENPFPEFGEEEKALSVLKDYYIILPKML